MGVRTKFEDIASMALIYTNRALGNKMISYDKVVEFENIINNNLDEMNSPINPSLFYEEESKLYFHATDENGKVYLVIDPRADLKIAGNYHVGCLPLDIVIASQMENALDVLGIELIDGKLVMKNKIDKSKESAKVLIK